VVLVVFLRSVRRLLVTANVPSSPILVTLIMEALCSSQTSVFSRAAPHNIPEDSILHSHRRENLKSYAVIPVTDDFALVKSVLKTGHNWKRNCGIWGYKQKTNSVAFSPQANYTD
jgi:hypothetical protein